MKSITTFLSSKSRNSLPALCLLLFAPVAAYGDNQAAVAQLSDSVIVDASEQRAYIMRLKAGIQAIDLATGQSVWKSADADRPLSTNGSVLLAQVEATKKGTLALAYLDTATGQLIESSNVALPDDVRARVVDSLDTRFSVKAISGGGSQDLYWTHAYKKVHGAPLRRDQAPAQRSEGFAEADFAKRTAKAATAPTGFKASVDHRAPMPADAPGKRAAYSTDRQHIVTSTALSAEIRSNSESGARYQWHVYSTAGQKIQSFESPVSFAPFVVVGNKLMYVTHPRKQRRSESMELTPMSLVTIDLATGEPLYTVAVRDTRYRGPFPP